MYIASQTGHGNVGKELINQLADVNQCDNDGVSPMYVASEYGHDKVVDSLLQYSVEVNRLNKNFSS